MTIDEKTDLRINRLENDRDELYVISTRIEGKLDTLDAEFRDFKAEMLEFKADMLSWRAEMTGFQADMLNFRAEMLEFKAATEHRLERIETVLVEILRRLPAPS